MGKGGGEAQRLTSVFFLPCEFEVMEANPCLPSPSKLSGRDRKEKAKTSLSGVSLRSSDPPPPPGQAERPRGSCRPVLWWLLAPRWQPSFSLGWGWGWRKLPQRSEVIQASYHLGYTLSKFGKQRRCGESLNSLGDAQTLRRLATAFPQICRGAGGEGVGGGGGHRAQAGVVRVGR